MSLILSLLRAQYIRTQTPLLLKSKVCFIFCQLDFRIRSITFMTQEFAFAFCKWTEKMSSG